MFGSRWTASAAVLFLLADASASAAPAPGLDLLLIIDRSTSMTHRPLHDDVMLRMAADLLARDAEANRALHRLAVIGFGSAANIELPFTSVRRDDASLRRRIADLRYFDRGQTDVLAAFTLGERVFRTIPEDPERRRAIVLLTDGVTYVRGADAKVYRRKLRDFVTDHLTRNGITVDVLLLDPRYRALWSAFARVCLSTSAAEDLLPRVHAVMARLAGTRTAESETDTLVIPPYLEIVVFDVFHAAREASVDIFAPGAATPIRAGRKGILSFAVGDVLSTVVVPHPPPGEWIIRKSRPEARVRVLSQQFFPRGALLRPGETERLRRCARISLVYRVLDAHGEPLRELEDYALALEMQIAKPNGLATTVAMERDATLGAAAFRSAEDPVCDAAGRYWTDVRVTAVDVKGHRLEVFRDRWSGFSVGPADCAPSSITKKPNP